MSEKRIYFESKPRILFEIPSSTRVYMCIKYVCRTVLECINYPTTVDYEKNRKKKDALNEVHKCCGDIHSNSSQPAAKYNHVTFSTIFNGWLICIRFRIWTLCSSSSTNMHTQYGTHRWLDTNTISATSKCALSLSMCNLVGFSISTMKWEGNTLHNVCSYVWLRVSMY